MCQSRADGGQRCSAYTKVEVGKAGQAYTAAVLAAARHDAHVAAAEEAVAARLGCDVHSVHPDTMDLDPGVITARRARYDADEDAMRARRRYEDTLVEHATTEAGRSEVLAALAAANDKGEVNRAARMQHVLMRADDLKEARSRCRGVAADPDRRRTRVYG